MLAVPERCYAIEEYLDRERFAEYKSELCGGRILARASCSPRHNRISGNICTILHDRLRKTDCHVFHSGQRIHVPRIEFSTYPDTSIIRGEFHLDSRDRDAIVNPVVIFEVLSESTESYDRGRKFDFYRQLDSLREYVLVAQDTPQVERFVRQQDNSWLLTVFKGMEAVLELGVPASVLPLAEIYEDVTFGLEEKSPPERNGS